MGSGSRIKAVKRRGSVEKDKERRLNRRVPVDLPAAARPQGFIRKKSALKGRTIDLALSGLQLQLEGKNRIKPGDAVDIRILEPKTQNPINLEGRVRWLAVVDEKSDSIRVGVVLTDLELDKYNDWISFLYNFLED